MATPHEILGLHSSASAEEVKSAYRRLAKEHHPDRNPGDDGEKFRQITSAYEALTKPQSDFGGFSFNGGTDLHRQMFEQMMQRMREQEARAQNADLQTTVEITLEQAFRGHRTIVSVDLGQRVDHAIDIPAGIQSGQRIRVTGAGLRRNASYPAGDLYVVVQIAPDSRFARAASDLLVQVEINALEAIVGKSITIAGIDDEMIPIVIPPATQFGARIRLADKGMRHLNSEERGSLIVEVIVKTPRIDEIDNYLVDEIVKLLPNRNPPL